MGLLIWGGGTCCQYEGGEVGLLIWGGGGTC